MPKKKGFVFVMSILTGIASCGCYWQGKRYIEAKKRWDKIEEELNRFEPYELKGDELKNLPWRKDTDLKEWQFKLVKVNGVLGYNREFVRRTKDSRMGYYVMAPLYTSNRKEYNKTTMLENGVIINLGWIPLDYKEELLNKITNEKLAKAKPKKKGSKEENNDFEGTQAEVIGIVRKVEQKDAASEFEVKPESKEHLYMDLQKMGKGFKLFNLIDASQAYIEKILPENAPEPSDLYPVAATIRSFNKPYLTPRKHLEYSTFWGCTTGVGLYSIIHYLRK